MDVCRIANFVVQAICVVSYFLFIVNFFKRRQPTPIWRWFVIVVVGLGLLALGRLLETAAYLFVKQNLFYKFSIGFQRVSTTWATYAFLIWNLYLVGRDRIAENKVFNGFLISVSAAVCLLICTNSAHHLFYEEATIGMQRVHGRLFAACVVWVYGMLFAGYIISLISIIRQGKNKARRIIVFSLYPLSPAIAALTGSITGADDFDYTSLVMIISVYCMYVIVFYRNYVNYIPQSMESALEQTESALIVYNKETGSVEYKNRAAEKYEALIPDIIERKYEAGSVFEQTAGDSILSIRVSDFDGGAARLITMTDITDLSSQRAQLDEEIKSKDAAVRELEDRRRNIDAYLDALYQIPDLKEKQELLTATQNDIVSTFETMSKNLDLALKDISNCEPLLNENIDKAKSTLTSVRAAVAKLKDGM